jgi:serine/threonine-protein kinase
VLGAVELGGAAADPRALVAQPKRFALLVLLALSDRGRFLRRDSILALLWPELSSDGARHALRQALHVIRRAVGPDVVARRGEDEVGINLDLLAVDALDFERAIDEGRLTDALSLYTGDLLPGFFAADVSPEFQQWLDGERDRLKGRGAAAAWRAADEALSAGQGEMAAHYARFAVRLAPDDEAAFRRLLETLDRIGDRVGAVRAYDDFRRRLAVEFGVEPDEQTIRLINAIRERPATAPASARRINRPTNEIEERPDSELTNPRAPVATPLTNNVLHLRRRVLQFALAVAALVVVGSLLATAMRGFGSSGQSPRVAVLPFESVGDSGDAVFAEGLADEIRGKLAALPGLRVIAGTSTREYKGTTKPLDAIADELDVRYVLVGRLLWQTDSAGVRRVRVSPELVETKSRTTTWRHSYDARLWDVFQVQSQIAEHVADALGVEVRAADEHAIRARPTTSVPAYEAYLRGRDLLLATSGITGVRQAIEHFETAVRLDSSFALAWAWLAEARLRDIRTSVGQGEDDESRRIRFAAERALRLSPSLPEGHLALADYYSAVLLDYPRAMREYALGLVAAPNSAELLAGLADVEQGRGEWEQSMEHLRRAVEIDPRSATSLMRLHRAYLWLRRYPEALEIAERAIAVRPQHAYPRHAKVMVHLAAGDLASAHATLRSAESPVGLMPLAAYMAFNWDLAWALTESEQQRLLASTPADFDGETVALWFAMQDLHYARGDLPRARAYADSTLRVVEDVVKGGSTDPQNHIKLGLAHALLGRAADAVREAKIAVAMVPLSRDAYLGAYALHQQARIETMAGAKDSAVARLEALLAIPYFVSPGWLKVDPTWRPLHGHPRFDRLLSAAP